MATWTPITDIGWTGKIITVTMWNTNFGANGNMEYIKETYARYYQASAATVSVPNNTTTTMASYTIPVGWGDGLYFISMNVEPSAANELAADVRRQVQISVGGVLSSSNYVSVLSASGFRPTYNITLYRRLTVGTVISYNFFQLGTAANFVLRATVQKVGV
jgi:hypothetical protein